MALTNEIEWKLALSDENRILIVTKSFRLVIFFAYSRVFFVIFFAFHRNAPPPFSFHSLATNLPEIEIVVSSLKKKKKREKLILAIRVAAVHRSRFEIFECGNAL